MTRRLNCPECGALRQAEGAGVKLSESLLECIEVRLSNCHPASTAFELEATTVRELVRVYRLATSEHMRECLIHGDVVGPGELLDGLFPEGRS